MEKQNASMRVNEELEQEIMSQKLQNSEKNQIIQELNSILKAFENKFQKVEQENFKIKEILEEYQQSNEDLTFKCERLASQSKISETITANLKQAQEDYESYLKEEKGNFENKEKELKDKYEALEKKLKKNFQTKEFQLKQEVNRSIEDIQRSIDISDIEHTKMRNENIALKESIKNINENYSVLEHSLHDQIDKLEQDLQAIKISYKEKAALLERTESVQRYEKNKLDSMLTREKELEMLVKNCEEKGKTLENKYIEAKRQIDILNSEVNDTKSELQREISKSLSKDQEIEILTQKDKEFQSKINKLKEEKIEESDKLLKDFEDKLESNSNMLRMQLLKEIEPKVDEYKGKIHELISENKILKGKLEQKSSEFQKFKEKDLKENLNSSQGSLSDEISILKQKLSKLSKQKSALEEKFSTVKDEYLDLEQKIKQDSVFFRNETQRKDDEFNRVKKKFETKLREIYAENSLITEQLRTDLLRLNNEIRNRDTKDSCYWISKNIEDLMNRIPSY